MKPGNNRVERSMNRLNDGRLCSRKSGLITGGEPDERGQRHDYDYASVRSATRFGRGSHAVEYQGVAKGFQLLQQKESVYVTPHCQDSQILQLS